MSNARRLARRLALLTLIAFAPCSRGDESGPRILSPALGRPAFVEPGGELTIAAALPDGEAVREARLVHPRIPTVTWKLQLSAPAADTASGAPFRARIPADVPARTYDLELQTGATTVRARHCVAIAAWRNPLRIVHLADMNIGDLSVPAFETRLIDEINLLAPTAIVLSGDLIDATHPNPAAAWPRLVDSLCEFDAPLIVAAGDHDDAELFARCIAPSPIGTVDCGPHRFIVLNDHALAPLARDADQLRWADTALRSDCAGMRIVISHMKPAAELTRSSARPSESTAPFGLWFAGGGTLGTSPGRDARVLLTPPASSLIGRDGDGVARYRLIDIDPSAAGGKTPLSAVLPVASTRLALATANDGSATKVSFAALNQNGTGLSRLSTYVRIAKSGPQRPWIRGAKLESIADLGACWECRVAFDLPEKSTLRATVGTGAPPPEPKVQVGFELPAQMTLAAARGAQRGALQPLRSGKLEVALSNLADTPLDCSPQVRLDGDIVPWRIDGRTRDLVLTAQLRIEPRETLVLRLDFSDARVRPGRRSLVVYVNDGQTLTPVTREFEAVPGARQ